MTKLTQHASRRRKRLSAAVGILLLSLVSGCGLFMDNEDRLDRGEAAFAEGDFRTAIIDAKDVLRDEPNNLRGRLLLGRASVEAGDGASAEKELRRAIQLGTKMEDIAADMARALLFQGKFAEVLSDVPLQGIADDANETTVRVVHGDAHLGLQRPEAAREMYLSALQLDAENLDARLGMASSFVAEKNFLQARSTIEHVLSTHADSSRVWLYSASFNMQTGDFESAEANFAAANDLALAQDDTPARLQALSGLAESLLEQQNIDAARPHVEQLAADWPNALQALLLTGRLAYADQEWTVAQTNLRKVLQRAPDYRPAQMLLGAVHLNSGNLSQAEMYLSAAVASVPSDVRARQLLAETQLQMQKADEALDSLAPLVSGPNADVLSLQMAARASLGSSNVDGALDYLRRSIADNPGNADLKFLLALTLLQSGRHDESQAVLSDIDVAGSEGNAYRRDALGVLAAMRNGERDVALQSSQQLVATYSDRSGAFNLHGAVQLAHNEPATARASFEQAVTLNPGDTMSRRYLAMLDESDGDHESAVRRYKSVLVDNPDAAWAMSALGRVALQQADHASAAAYFRQALEAEPGNPNHRLGVAKAERGLGNNELASSVLEDEIEASIEHLPSAIMLGTLKAEAGDVTGAMDMAKRLQKKYPDNPVGYALEGEVHIVTGGMVRADAAYDKALSMGLVKNHVLRSHQIKRHLDAVDAQRPLIEFLAEQPLDNRVRVVLAESYLQNNNLPKSITEYERVVSDDPANAVALNNLAWSYYLADDPRAVGTARKAHEAMPGNGAIVDTLGWIMVQTGAVEEGESLLRKAADMENGRAEIRYHHAVALSKLGKSDEARTLLHQVLQGDEEFSSRRDAEKLLTEL